MSEVKNTLEVINSRFDEAEDWISYLKDKIEKNQNSKNTKKELKSEESFRYFWDKMVHNNIHINTVLEWEERDQGIENIFKEIMNKTNYNLGEEKRHTSPVSTKSPKQDRPKESHTKTHHH